MMIQRKVVISPEAFTKIAEYVNSLPVPFALVEKATDVKKALAEYQLMDIEIKEQPNNTDK